MVKKERFLNYIGIQFHTDPNIDLKLVNSTTGEELDPPIKCGITVMNAESTEVLRFEELGRTKAPIGWMPIYVAESSSRQMQMRIENGFKILCDNVRVKTNGLTEYYDLSIDAAIKYYENQGAKDVCSEFLTEQFHNQSGLTTGGAKKVRSLEEKRKEMKAKYEPTGLFNKFGSTYAEMKNYVFPDLNNRTMNVSFCPKGGTTFINYYHGGKFTDDEEFESMINELSKEKGITPVFRVKACRLDLNSHDEGLEMYRILKEQNFVPINYNKENV